MEIVKTFMTWLLPWVFFGAVGAYVALLISLSRLLLKPEKKPEKKEKQIWNH